MAQVCIPSTPDTALTNVYLLSDCSADESNESTLFECLGFDLNSRLDLLDQSHFSYEYSCGSDEVFPLSLSLSQVYNDLVQEISESLEKALPLEQVLPIDDDYHQVDYLNKSHSDFDWRTTLNPFQRIYNLRYLDDNWDGYGASRFSNIVIKRSLELYSAFQNYIAENRLDFELSKPFVAPCSDGSVLFEWAGRNHKSKNLEVYIHEDKSDVEYLQINLVTEDENCGCLPLSQIYSLFDWLFLDAY